MPYVDLVNFSQVVSIYPTFEAAWSAINKMSPPLTTLVLRGALLKKAAKNNQWVVLTLHSEASLQITPESVVGECGFVRLFVNHRLLGLDLSLAEQSFLLFLCRWLLKCCKSSQLCGDVCDTNEDVVIETLCTLHESKKSISLEKKLVSLMKEVLMAARTNDSKPISQLVEQAASDLNARDLLDAWPRVAQRLQPYILKSISKHRFLIDFLEGNILSYLGPIITQDTLETMSAVVLTIQPLKTLQSDDAFISSSEPEDVDSDFEDYGMSSMYREFDGDELTAPFEGRGFGPKNVASGRVLSLLGPSPNLFVHFPQGSHNPRDLPLAFIYHDALYSIINKHQKIPLSQFNKWLTNVLLSPLSSSVKEWFLKRCQIHLAHPLKCTSILDSVVSSCLASACPDPILRSYFLGACQLRPSLGKFCK